jgi:hypothetical protein
VCVPDGDEFVAVLGGESVGDLDVLVVEEVEPHLAAGALAAARGLVDVEDVVG